MLPDQDYSFAPPTFLTMPNAWIQSQAFGMVRNVGGAKE
jgi:hypothetical protein